MELVINNSTIFHFYHSEAKGRNFNLRYSLLFYHLGNYRSYRRYKSEIMENTYTKYHSHITCFCIHCFSYIPLVVDRDPVMFIFFPLMCMTLRLKKNGWGKAILQKWKFTAFMLHALCLPLQILHAAYLYFSEH